MASRSGGRGLLGRAHFHTCEVAVHRAVDHVDSHQQNVEDTCHQSLALVSPQIFDDWSKILRKSQEKERRKLLVFFVELVLIDGTPHDRVALEKEDEEHSQGDWLDDEDESVGETERAEVCLFVGVRRVLADLVPQLLAQGRPVEVVEET